jgi:hypothetical protein
VLFTHSRDDGDEDFLSIIEKSLDLVTDFALGDLDVVLGGTVLVNQVKETVVDVEEGVFDTENVGDVHVVCGGGEIFELLSVEDLGKSV